jgi:hypothetical protein
MKYYLRELQDFMNSENDSAESTKHAIKIARKQARLHKEYLSQLSQLQKRITARTYTLLHTSSDPLFDSNLMAFSIGDSVRKKVKYGAEWFHTEVFIRLITFEEDAIYTLKYRGVDSVRFDLPHEKWYNWPSVHDIGCLLSHEVLPADEVYLSHEFLFTSGATLMIKFKKLDFEKMKIKKGSFKSRHLSENLK